MLDCLPATGTDLPMLAMGIALVIIIAGVVISLALHRARRASGTALGIVLLIVGSAFLTPLVGGASGAQAASPCPTTPISIPTAPTTEEPTPGAEPTEQPPGDEALGQIRLDGPSDICGPIQTAIRTNASSGGTKAAEYIDVLDSITPLVPGEVADDIAIIRAARIAEIQDRSTDSRAAPEFATAQTAFNSYLEETCPQSSGQNLFTRLYLYEINMQGVDRDTQERKYQAVTIDLTYDNCVDFAVTDYRHDDTKIFTGTFHLDNLDYETNLVAHPVIVNQVLTYASVGCLFDTSDVHFNYRMTAADGHTILQGSAWWSSGDLLPGNWSQGGCYAPARIGSCVVPEEGSDYGPTYFVAP